MDGQGRVLPVRSSPRRSGCRFHDDVEVVIAPLLRPEQPRDIPDPHLVRRRWPSTASCTRDGRPAFLRMPEHADGNSSSSVRVSGLHASPRDGPRRRYNGLTPRPHRPPSRVCLRRRPQLFPDVDLRCAFMRSWSPARAAAPACVPSHPADFALVSSGPSATRCAARAWSVLEQLFNATCLVPVEPTA